MRLFEPSTVNTLLDILDPRRVGEHRMDPAKSCHIVHSMGLACRAKFSVSILDALNSECLCFLEWIRDGILLPQIYLLPLLRDSMLHKHLLCVLFHERADESGIPKLTGDTKVLTASHQRVRFAAFNCGRDAFGGEVVLFAAGDRNESGEAGQNRCSPCSILEMIY